MRARGKGGKDGKGKGFGAGGWAGPRPSPPPRSPPPLSAALWTRGVPNGVASARFPPWSSIVGPSFTEWIRGCSRSHHLPSDIRSVHNTVDMQTLLRTRMYCLCPRPPHV
eukprot:gene17226-biopygen13214